MARPDPAACRACRADSCHDQFLCFLYIQVINAENAASSSSTKFLLRSCVRECLQVIAGAGARRDSQHALSTGLCVLPTSGRSWGGRGAIWGDLGWGDRRATERSGWSRRGRKAGPRWSSTAASIVESSPAWCAPCLPHQSPALMKWRTIWSYGSNGFLISSYIWNPESSNWPNHVEKATTNFRWLLVCY
jgi:hypothetical protein